MGLLYSRNVEPTSSARVEVGDFVFCTQDATIDILSGDGIILVGEYVAVTCDENTCMPVVEEKTYSVFESSIKNLNEPYSGEGDFDVTKETFDGLHPNEAGEAKMAKRWYDALAMALASKNETASVSQDRSQAQTLSALRGVSKARARHPENAISR